MCDCHVETYSTIAFNLFTYLNKPTIKLWRRIYFRAIHIFDQSKTALFLDRFSFVFALHIYIFVTCKCTLKYTMKPVLRLLLIA